MKLRKCLIAAVICLLAGCYGHRPYSGDSGYGYGNSSPYYYQQPQYVPAPQYYPPPVRYQPAPAPSWHDQQLHHQWCVNHPRKCQDRDDD